jgi:predicted nucleic acid-binding Zn ribbon protein
VPLVACPTCGHRVSDQARTCPSCGQPLTQYRKLAGRVIGRIILLAVLALAVLGLALAMRYAWLARS